MVLQRVYRTTIERKDASASADAKVPSLSRVFESLRVVVATRGHVHIGDEQHEYQKNSFSCQNSSRRRIAFILDTSHERSGQEHLHVNVEDIETDDQNSSRCKEDFVIPGGESTCPSSSQYRVRQAMQQPSASLLNLSDNIWIRPEG